ncbi:hypothetical protein E3N88_16634 [Mikania micrantha]|uniref:Uncharacterized protein n=1 Tax=Mikania micrantha TaxID=192012 RepID=A0A5N6NYY8_9ASTR|nr:hypothetical protein E3N88_16634 [Mikania micrantha]
MASSSSSPALISDGDFFKVDNKNDLWSGVFISGGGFVLLGLWINGGGRLQEAVDDCKRVFRFSGGVVYALVEDGEPLVEELLVNHWWRRMVDNCSKRRRAVVGCKRWRVVVGR